MSPETAFSRLNSKIQSYERGLGGPEFTYQDIMLASSLITSSGARHLALVKVSGFESSTMPALVCDVALDILARAPRDGWHPPGGEELRQIAELAIYEAVHPPKCPACHGTMWRITGIRARGRPRNDDPTPRRIACDRCYRGHVRPSMYWRWKRSGMGRKRFEQYWAPHYERTIMPILDDYESGWRRAIFRLLNKDLEGRAGF